MNFRFLLVTILTTIYSCLALNVDQCSEDDIFFTKTNMEIKNPNLTWQFTFTTDKPSKCFTGCKSHTKCQTATFFEQRQECQLKDANRFHPKSRFKLSPDAQMFEKRNCSVLDTGQNSNFIKAVPGTTDCLDVYRKGWKRDGVYGVKAGGDFYRPILCRMSLYGGGWTVFQNRYDGSVPFNQPWKSYQEGFGDLRTEFWYGNDMLHNLTNGNSNQLLVYLKHNGLDYYPLYNQFNIGSEANKYRLSISDEVYSNFGTRLPSFSFSLTHHNHNQFTTTDIDNDASGSRDCSNEGGGAGWWMASCYSCNLNGAWGVDNNSGMKWHPLTNGCSKGCVRESTMLVRRRV